MLTLKTREDKLFKIDKKIIKPCKLLNEMLEESEKDEHEIIELNEINEKSLKRIIKFLEYESEDSNKKIENNIIVIKKDDKYTLNIPEFYLDLLKINNDFNIQDLKDITNASNFLGIELLLELCCAKIASLIKGKSKEEMRFLLDIKNDLSEYEEKTIKKEHEWIHLLNPNSL